MDARLDKHIRGLSHDIRNTLTVISLYSKYIAEKDELEVSEVQECATLIEQKAKQAMMLFDHLLNGSSCNKVYVKDGKSMLMDLIKEWGISLRSKFSCQINMDDCYAFSGNFDIDELRRIFDNLVSNIEKYADPKSTVSMKITTTKTDLVIEEENTISDNPNYIESSGFGLDIIRHIAENHGGDVVVIQNDQQFTVKMRLPVLLNKANGIAV